MVKYIFFDLDETLIDIKAAQNEAVECLYSKYAFNTKTTIRDFLHKWDELTEYHYAFYSRKEISYSEQRVRRVVDLFKAYDIKLEEDPLVVYDYYLRFFEDCWKVYPEVKEVLDILVSKGYKLGVISNGDYAQQLQKIEKTGIRQYFDFINTSSQFDYSKPDPRVFMEIFKLHNIDHNDVCYIGDSYKKDVLPCRSLGIKSVLIERRHREYEDDEMIVVSNLKEILSLLDHNII